MQLDGVLCRPNVLGLPRNSAAAAGMVFVGAREGVLRGWEKPGVEEDVAGGEDEDGLVVEGGGVDGAALGEEGAVAPEAMVRWRGRGVNILADDEGDGRASRERRLRRQEAQMLIVGDGSERSLQC